MKPGKTKYLNPEREIYNSNVTLKPKDVFESQRGEIKMFTVQMSLTNNRDIRIFLKEILTYCENPNRPNYNHQFPYTLYKQNPNLLLHIQP